MIIVNASPVIVLGKQGRLDLLAKCFHTVVIPGEAYREVARKKESTEALALEKAIQDNLIKVEQSVVLPLLAASALGRGEKEAISLAARHKAMLIIDDDTAKSYARIMGVEAHGCLFVLFRARAKKILAQKEAIDLLTRMIQEGFYISTSLYAEFLRKISP